MIRSLDELDPLPPLGERAKPEQPAEPLKPKPQPVLERDLSWSFPIDWYVERRPIA